MTTIYEITGDKTYKQLLATDKLMIQERQTELVTLIQDGYSELVDELVDSFKGLIKGMAYRQAEKSFTVEQDDFEGLMYEELWRSVLKFDRSLGVPFTPVFITSVRNAIKMMYRSKSYDLHDTTYGSDELRLDKQFSGDKNTNSPSQTESKGARTVIAATRFESYVDHKIAVDQVLLELFGDNLLKHTVIYMYLEGFKRNEIVSATGITERTVNRTVNNFKESYITLT